MPDIGRRGDRGFDPPRMRGIVVWFGPDHADTVTDRELDPVAVEHRQGIALRRRRAMDDRAAGEDGRFAIDRGHGEVGLVDPARLVFGESW